MASKLDLIIDSIVEDATSSFAESVIQSQEKTASVNTDLNLELDDVAGLSKIATILRTTSIEPSYEDLYNFVGGLYGSR